MAVYTGEIDYFLDDVHYRIGTPIPADVVAKHGLTRVRKVDAAGGSEVGAPSLKDEIRAILARRAESGDAEAAEMLEGIDDDDDGNADPSQTDLPNGFPGRKVFEDLGYQQADVDALDRDGLIAIDNIGEKTADAILALRSPQ